MDIMRNTKREQLQIDACVTSLGKGAYEEEFNSLGGRILRCSLNTKNPFSFYYRFKHLLSTEHYDVVHSHSYYFSGFILRAAANAAVPKRVAHIHPVEDQKKEEFLRGLYTRWMKNWIRSYGTSFVGPTKASLEAFWGADWQKDPAKQVIYNGIKVDRFIQPVGREGIRRELGIPETAPIVINVSRFVPHKRHEFLVQVAEHVLAQRKDVYFLLIGAGPLKEEIEEQVHAKALQKNFRFISNAPNIDKYWMAADLLAFPSCNEGFGIVIIEAAAAGLRVIAQDIPGVREAAEACLDPVLLPVETSAEEWAHVLLDALRKPRMSESQRQRLLKEFPFTIESSVAKLKEIYRS
jgi:glycosyltransferase EpsF